MSDIEEKVFEAIDEYVCELKTTEELRKELPEDEGLVQFCREFFNQFFATEFQIDLSGFTEDDAVDVWLNTEQKLSDEDSREPIVLAFREFCQEFETITTERYDTNGQLSDFQKVFVPELLELIVAWDVGGSVGGAAGHALSDLRDVLSNAADPS